MDPLSGNGGAPQSQLTEGVGDSSCLLLPGVVAVLGCCIVTARTVQGMARVRSGQALAWPLVSGRRGCRGSDAQGRVPKMISAKRFEMIFGCP